MAQNFHSKEQEAENLLKQKGIDPKHLQKADVERLFSSLSTNDTAQLTNLLQDKKALEQVLNSPAAKQMMAKFFGKNGAN